jgi:hypothetical protein
MSENDPLLTVRLTRRMSAIRAQTRLCRNRQRFRECRRLGFAANMPQSGQKRLSSLVNQNVDAGKADGLLYHISSGIRAISLSSVTG